jgi:hypothetical protein
MCALRQAAEDAETRAALKEDGAAPWDVQNMMLDIRLQKIKNLESRFQVRDSERRLK